jgi:hypothetical protein
MLIEELNEKANKKANKKALSMSLSLPLSLSGGTPKSPSRSLSIARRRRRSSVSKSSWPKSRPYNYSNAQWYYDTYVKPQHTQRKSRSIKRKSKSKVKATNSHSHQPGKNEALVRTAAWLHKKTKLSWFVGQDHALYTNVPQGTNVNDVYYELQKHLPYVVANVIRQERQYGIPGTFLKISKQFAYKIGSELRLTPSTIRHYCSKIGERNERKYSKNGESHGCHPWKKSVDEHRYHNYNNYNNYY